MSDEHHADLVAKLESVVADLDERMFDMLREASSRGEARPAADKRLSQARRAVEKAIHLLREDGGPSED